MNQAKLEKRTKTGSIVKAAAIKNTFVREDENTGESLMMLTYVTATFYEKTVPCSVGVFKRAQDKKSSRDIRAVPMSRKTNMEFLVETDHNVVMSIDMYPKIDGQYKELHKDSADAAFLLDVDTETGSINVKETPAGTSAKEVRKLLDTLAGMSVLAQGDADMGWATVTAVTGCKVEVTPV